MEQYIDKNALLERIKKLKMDIGNIFNEYDEGFWEGRSTAFDNVICALDTLEAKEVDLEDAKKEELAQKYIDYTFKRHNIDPYSKEGQLIYYAYMHGMNQCLTQLKAQKGE